MLHPKHELTLLAYVASLIGQILTLCRFATDPATSALKLALERAVQAFPVEAALAAAAFAVDSGPMPEERKRSDLQNLQVSNFGDLRKHCAAQFGEDFAVQVFDGKEPPPDPTVAETASRASALARENAELKAQLESQARQFDERLASLERRAVIPGPAPV